MQRGDYAVNSTSTVAVLNSDGYFTVFSGHPIDNYSEPSAPLLYLVELVDRVDTSTVTTSSSHGTYHSTLDHTWTTAHGDMQISLDWNRSSDVVTIGSDSYDRSVGMLFLARANADGTIATHQIRTEKPSPTQDEVLATIRQRFTDDDVLSNLTICDKH
ncbi:hypothetical protein Pla22_28050 [Rubripirellula amarantea]|uniref:Uncharacterized protein n=2 Tax=Rubripirellula amarantea TaxID=2527999 RepID=A0A5C5WYJ3_9BACT|nr:hypothetical protein Pla22_28050 [Rubripirellula amarantea]